MAPANSTYVQLHARVRGDLPQLARTLNNPGRKDQMHLGKTQNSIGVAAFRRPKSIWTVDFGVPGRNRIRLGRALALVRAGKHQVATAEANRVDINGLAPELIYLPAKVFSVASLAVRDDYRVDNDIQVGLERQYADQAVAYLRAYEAANFFNDAEKVERHEGDADFLHLHKRTSIRC